MQLLVWKNSLLAVSLVILGVVNHCIKVDAASVKKSNTFTSPNSSDRTQKLLLDANHHLELYSNNEFVAAFNQYPEFELFDVDSTQPVLLNLANAQPSINQEPPAPSENIQIAPNTTTTENREIAPQSNETPQLDAQPPNFLPITPSSNEDFLETPINHHYQKLAQLRQRLREARKSNFDAQNYRELGLRVRARALPSSPLEQTQPPETQRSEPKFKPIASLQGRVGYFHTSNIFSAAVDPIDDGLFLYGLRLASKYFPLGKHTYINGSIDGNLIRYVDQSKFNYNQLRFNLSVYQQLSRRMFGEVSWSNQQLFYANSSDVFTSGDRFLNEQSLRLSVGRSDPLSQKLMLDSFYEFSWNWSDPERRSRLVNFLWLALNYKIQKPLEIGLNYQLSLSDFTKRDRYDQVHRLYTSLIYRLSKTNSVNFQTGFSFGDSTVNNIDFDGWFLSINYNVLISDF